MSRWLYNFIVSALVEKKTGTIEINLFEGGLSNVIFKQSFKQPNNAEAAALV